MNIALNFVMANVQQKQTVHPIKSTTHPCPDVISQPALKEAIKIQYLLIISVQQQLIMEETVIHLVTNHNALREDILHQLLVIINVLQQTIMAGIVTLDAINLLVQKLDIMTPPRLDNHVVQPAIMVELAILVVKVTLLPQKIVTGMPMEHVIYHPVLVVMTVMVHMQPLYYHHLA